MRYSICAGSAMTLPDRDGFSPLACLRPLWECLLALLCLLTYSSLL